MPFTTTWAPSAASASAKARPRPLEAPVTTMRLPATWSWRRPYGSHDDAARSANCPLVDRPRPPPHGDVIQARRWGFLPLVRVLFLAGGCLMGDAHGATLGGGSPGKMMPPTSKMATPGSDPAIHVERQPLVASGPATSGSGCHRRVRRTPRRSLPPTFRSRWSALLFPTASSLRRRCRCPNDRCSTWRRPSR